MNETGLSARGGYTGTKPCSSSDNEVANAVLQNWFFVQDFWPMGQRFSRNLSLPYIILFIRIISPLSVFSTEQTSTVDGRDTARS